MRDFLPCSARLTESLWRQWTRSFRRSAGTVVLPKFTLTYKARLNDALTKMGMGVAFSDDADFSRIHQPPPPLKITDVSIARLSRWTSNGTEAAAATSVR